MQTNEEIEQWTEIRLSHSESSSSGYSNGGSGANVEDATSQADDTSSSSNSECNKKVTCTTVMFQEKDYAQQYSGAEKKEGISSWLSKSGSLKSSGRRQSLDLLIDASDRVKDVFTSFSKVGKSLERRNSESELPQTEQPSNNDFFSFR